MSDLEYNYDSDDHISQNHSKLVDAVRQLDKRPSFKATVDDPLTIASLKSSGWGLDEDSNTNKVKKKVKTVGKDDKPIQDVLSKKVLPKPLEKIVENRIKRRVGYEKTKKDLTKWTGIIARNRTAASISFPISQSSMKLEPSSEFTKRFRLKSELEKKLEELEPPKEPEPEEDKFKLTYEEMLEKRKEAAKLRAQQSYNAAKARRQNKIKSKKFHRLQKKERVKKTLKEFEELQKIDPQAALEKLEEIDKARAHERMTLRHKSTGQWAKNKQIRAKYDKESRQVLAEQLSISKQLTQKVKKDIDSEDDDNFDDQPLKFASTDKENPWISGVKTETEIDQFISGYRKFWDEKNKNQNGPNEDNKNEPDFKCDITANGNSDEAKQKKSSSKNNKICISDTKNSINQKLLEPSNKKIKNLQKTSKDKLGIKTLNNKVKKINTQTKIKAGTSNWAVSEIKNHVNCVEIDRINETNFQLKNNNSSEQNNFDIDDMFDSMEDKIQEKINKKLSKVKKILEPKPKKGKKKNNSKNEKESNSDIDKLGLKGQQNIRPIIDGPNEESTNSVPNDKNLSMEKISEATTSNNEVSSKVQKTEIDPNKFMNIKPKHLETMLPDEMTADGVLDDSDSEENQQKIISEAFADDDVIDEFRKEKEDEIKNSQPQDIDLTLPGWGSWGGKNIKPSNRKKRRFILKFPKVAPRRDENKGDVVIIEEKCPKIKKHLVSELPFPFNSVKDYEASIRAPVGRDFVPEKTFSKLVQPAVKTKMGKIIEPMNEEVLIKKTEGLKKRKKPGKDEKNIGKKKKNNVNKKIKTKKS